MGNIPDGLFISIICLMILNYMLVRQQICEDYNFNKESVLTRQINIILIKLVVVIMLIYLFINSPDDNWLIIAIIYFGYRLYFDSVEYKRLSDQSNKSQDKKNYPLR